MLRIFLTITVSVATCEQGRPQADATDAAALGPAPLGAPRLWGPRASGGPVPLGVPRLWGPRAMVFG